MKKAIVTGITGQDGSYLAELLLEKGYRVIGLHRRSSVNNFERIQHLIGNPNFVLSEFDLTDPSSVIRTIDRYKPDEFYNLAAQSHVGTSFNQPTTTFEIDTVGVVNILEAIRNYSPNTRFYQASTSEMFGRSYDIDEDGIKYQDEDTELLPQSPYGVAKVAAHRMVQIYRDAYGIYASSGILFNHESPRRGENFVTRKITKWIGDFLKWKDSLEEVENHLFVNETDTETIQYWSILGPSPDEQYLISEFPKLRLGNLESFRDWGYAGDYVEAMWLMLQADHGEDYVVCTGETHTIREFLDAAFGHVGIEHWDKYVIQDEKFYRPAEVDYLMGLNTKAKTNLHWQPKTSFQELVVKMLESDIQSTNKVYEYAQKL